MAQVSQRTDFNGSALVRLLSRLTDIDVRESKQVAAARLSQWFDWTDAISLSAALNGGSPATAPVGARARASAEEGEYTRVRAALANAISADSTFTTAKGRGHVHAPAREDAVDPAADFTPYRRRYLALQQAMEAGVGPLRGRLRAALASRSPDMARLASVDVVMEQVLAAHERRLLSTVPALLEKHFERLQQQAGEAAPDEPDNGAQPGAWQDMFRKDIQDVLLAELDFRFQPVEGLLEALRARQQPECHD